MSKIREIIEEAISKGMSDIDDGISSVDLVSSQIEQSIKAEVMGLERHCIDPFGPDYVDRDELESLFSEGDNAK